MMSTPTPTVTVYATPVCPWCRRAKGFLREHGIQFQERDVTSDEQIAREMVTICGRNAVPVIVAGAEVIVGFDRQLPERLVDGLKNPALRPKLRLLARGVPDIEVEVGKRGPDRRSESWVPAWRYR